MTKKVAVVSGFWGQNIGNAFFNLGGKWILEQAFGSEAVGFIQDQPGYRTFNNQHKGNHPNALDLIGSLEVEVLVLQGPMLTTTFASLWRRTMARLNARGVKVILLGTGLFRYDDTEIAAARDFLKEFKPHAILTRDEPSFEAIQELDIPSHNGVDSAFALPHAYTPLPIDLSGDYVVLGFDRFPEPEFRIGEPVSTDRSFVKAGSFEFGAKLWQFDQPGIQTRASRLGKWQAYIGAALDRRSLPARLDDWIVVRPDHRTNPHVAWKVYKQPNSVASDEPFTYLSLYSQSSLTLSDRVHANIASLAYGRPAMLFTMSRRACLFDRLDLSAIRTKPVTLTAHRRDEEIFAEIDFLKKVT